MLIQWNVFRDNAMEYMGPRNAGKPIFLRCFDTAGWARGRISRLWNPAPITPNVLFLGTRSRECRSDKSGVCVRVCVCVHFNLRFVDICY